MHLTRPDGVSLWWESEGLGEPVVLLPGRGDSTDLFPTRFAAHLAAAGLAVIRYDPRDTGLSGDGGDRYTQADMVDDAVAVLEAAAGAGAAAHWVGVSMAGLQLVDLASRPPHLVRSLTFVSAMSPDPDAGFGEAFFEPPADDPAEALVAAMGTVTDADCSWATAEMARASGRAPARPEAVERHMAASFRLEWPTLDDLGRIDRPTQVFHGTDDRTLPIAHAHALAGGIPGAGLTFVDGMGHLPRPADWDAIGARLPFG